MYPTPAQETVLLRHCADARFVWNLGHEQRLMYRPGRGHTPCLGEQAHQLTEARAAVAWLAAGSQTVQAEALRDLDQAWQHFFAGAQRRPGWRKQGKHESFRVTGKRNWRLETINRRWSRVRVPKAGWVRFRRTRDVPAAKSYRIKRDRAGRWHISFPVIPAPISGPGTGEVVGIDRGVTASLTLSTGEMFRAPASAPRLRRLQRRLDRAKRGSKRRERAKASFARAKARNTDRRKDWIEKTSTSVARQFDLIRIEDLKIRNMTRSARGTLEHPGTNVSQKAGLNRGILAQGWGIFAQRLQDKAAGRVEKVSPAYTSQTCSACGSVDARSRENQARFACTSCGYTENADVNAAKNIAAGHAVTARGGPALAGPANREPRIAA